VRLYANETAFAGKTVLPWDSAKGIQNPATTTYRISVEYDESVSWLDKFRDFLNDPAVGQITALVIGLWLSDLGTMDDSSEVIEAVAQASHKLPNLTAIFLGDITTEESEISWINQTDVSPLFGAYPNLELFRVRGGNGLSFDTLRHEHLKALIVESGGLSGETVRDIMAAHLPALDHLELWLGTPEYGGSAMVPDLAPLFTGQPFPRLRYLGLRDSQIANELAVALAQSSVIEQIRVLDLSLGLLDDTGVLALLNNPALLKLEKLDIHYHYCTAKIIDRLTATLQAAGVALDASEPQLGAHGRDWRFVAVGE
jgi:hypothetical protein